VPRIPYYVKASLPKLIQKEDTYNYEGAVTVTDTAQSALTLNYGTVMALSCGYGKLLLPAANTASLYLLPLVKCQIYSLLYS